MQVTEARLFGWNPLPEWSITQPHHSDETYWVVLSSGIFFNILLTLWRSIASVVFDLENIEIKFCFAS